MCGSAYLGAASLCEEEQRWSYAIFWVLTVFYRANKNKPRTKRRILLLLSVLPRKTEAKYQSGSE